MYNNSDTIAALATSSGEGGIAIIRISGPEALTLLKKAFFPAGRHARFEHGRMVYGYVKNEDKSDIDEAMAVYFASPRSYTREDVCEIHTHGGLVSRMALERIIALGARPAERGEFTYRAFINGRLDLSRAEAVMNLISASSEQAARRSVRQLKSGVTSRIGRAASRLKELVTLIDAAADYPEEIDEDVTALRVKTEAEAVLKDILACADKRYARIMNEGARVVIAGKPNVGKSSVMNAVLCAERSIVTDIPGTTRDVINETACVNGLSFTLTDTAGIRETGDIIEKIGVNRAEETVKNADCVVLVTDASRPTEAEDRALLSKADERYILVANKSDIKAGDREGFLYVSALTGEGIKELCGRIYDMISPGEDDERLLTLRHISAANLAAEALARVKDAPFLDLMRSDCIEALGYLGEITGENVSESVIDSIFERFCVGK